MQSLHVREALNSWQQAVEAARRLHDLRLEGCPLARMPLGLVLLGQLEEAEMTARTACEVTRTIHDWGEGVSVALARGEFVATEQHAQETRAMASRSGYPWGGFRAILALACAYVLRGACREADTALDLLDEPGRILHHPGPVERVFVATFRLLVRAYAGDDPAMRNRQVPEVMLHVRTDSYSLAPLCALVELVDLMAAPSLAKSPAQALMLAAERGLLWSSGWMFRIPRVLGVAAMLQQQWDRAERYFHTAMAAAERSSARPELGRTYLDYARMLHARATMGDRSRALELLSRAGAMFADLGMAPFTHRVEQLTEVLHPPLAPDGASRPACSTTSDGVAPPARVRGV
jgi:hypothetical protein